MDISQEHAPELNVVAVGRRVVAAGRIPQQDASAELATFPLVVDQTANVRTQTSAMEDQLSDNAESAGSSADPPEHSETTKHAEEMDATAPVDVASLRMSQRACAAHVAAGMREARSHLPRTCLALVPRGNGPRIRSQQTLW